MPATDLAPLQKKTTSKHEKGWWLKKVIRKFRQKFGPPRFWSSGSASVFLYVYCLFVFLYVYLSVFILVCIPICLYSCMYTVCLHSCVYTCLFVFLYVYLFVCILVCIPVCLYSCMYTCLFVFLYYTCLCMNVCFYEKGDASGMKISRKMWRASGFEIGLVLHKWAELIRAAETAKDWTGL